MDTIEQIKHIEFPKIGRLSKATVYVSQKLDGSNAAIRIEGGKVVAIQSRKRLIEVGSDNYGFAAWVRANEQTLVEDLGDGLHFGEWAGKGINSGEGLQEKRFFLFDTRNAGRLWLTPQLDVVPLLGVINGVDTEKIKAIVDDLRINGSRVVPGFMKPEGVIVLIYDTQTRFKVMVENDDTHKGQHK